MQETYQVAWQETTMNELVQGAESQTSNNSPVAPRCVSSRVDANDAGRRNASRADIATSEHRQLFLSTRHLILRAKLSDE